MEFDAHSRRATMRLKDRRGSLVRTDKPLPAQSGLPIQGLLRSDETDIA
jgi:hypothetical protein